MRCVGQWSGRGVCRQVRWLIFSNTILQPRESRGLTRKQSLLTLSENTQQNLSMVAMDTANKLNVLDVEFLSVSMQEALSLIEQVIASGDKQCVSFINADCLNISCKDKEYHQILNSQDFVLPDGAGINIACRLVGERLVANLNGTDLMPELWETSPAKGYRFFLLGAAPGVTSRMKVKLEETYPGIKVVGEQHGYFDRETESDAVIEKINASKPNVLLVAFGAPAQEKWIYQNKDKIDTNLLVGVGGLFDFYSGDKKRAPMWMRKSGLEWMYRLYLEPGRLWRRYIVGNPLFIYRVFKWRGAERSST